MSACMRVRSCQYSEAAVCTNLSSKYQAASAHGSFRTSSTLPVLHEHRTRRHGFAWSHDSYALTIANGKTCNGLSMALPLVGDPGESTVAIEVAVHHRAVGRPPVGAHRRDLIVPAS